MKKEPIPKYGDHITIKKFLSWVKTGCIIDYDGYGKYATKTYMTDIIVRPSNVTRKRKMFSLRTGKFRIVKVKGINKRFSHVVWFNK